jgi:hypothetical protein
MAGAIANGAIHRSAPTNCFSLPYFKMTKSKSASELVLAIYLCLSTLALLSLATCWQSAGPMSGMGNGFAVVWHFGFVFILTILSTIALGLAGATFRIYAYAAGMFGLWCLILVANVS